jgi:hypothetical protein
MNVDFNYLGIKASDHPPRIAACRCNALRRAIIARTGDSSLGHETRAV